MKKRTARVLNWIGAIALAIGVLYAVLLASANRSLHRAYAALKADGRPIKVEQIIPAAIPDSDNAALIYKAVVLQLRSEPGAKGDLFAELGDLASRMQAEVLDSRAAEQFGMLLERRVAQDAMATLCRGTGKTGCRYDLDYSKGAGILLPHVADLRNLSRILCARARLNAAQGKVEESWDDVIASLRLANALRSEPLLVSQLVRIAQFGLVANLVPSVAASGPPSKLQYDEMEKLLPAFEDIVPFVAAMDGERLVLGEWLFNLPRSELRKTLALADCGVGSVMAMGAVFSPLLYRDHVAYLTVMRAYTRNAGMPYSSGDAALDEELLNRVPRYCILTRMFTPALSAARRSYVSMIARARVMRAGLAVLRYAEDADAYPSDLSALQTSSLVDPFSGKALCYHETASGFILYSVGENLVDDGGTTSKERRSGDIVWRTTAR